MRLCHVFALGLAAMTCSSLAQSPAHLTGSNPFLLNSSIDQGWPFVRGPAFDGRSPEIHIADSWPEDGPPLMWSRSLGQGYSGIVSLGLRLYTQYQDLFGQYVICMNGDTGETIWQYRYDLAYEPAGLYPGPRATPTIAKGRVFFSGTSGLVACLDAKSGDVIWSRELKAEFDGKGTDFGYASSPSVVAGRVILPVGGENAAMVALSVKDGRVLWRSGSEPCSYTPAMPIKYQGRTCILGYMRNSLTCYESETGEELWTYPLSMGYDEHSAWPLFSNGHVWFAAPFRHGSQLLRIDPNSSVGFTEVYSTKLMSNDVRSSVLVSEHIYGFDLKEVQAKPHRPSRGAFRCIDFLTGKERWSTEATGHASVLEVDGKLILFNDEGELILVQTSSERYIELGRAPVFEGQISWTGPTLHRGRVYLRNHSQIACVLVGEVSRLLAKPTLTVADVPKSTHWDLSFLLGVEPEYLMDAPSLTWLQSWFVYSVLGVIGPAAALCLVMWLIARNHIGAGGWWWLFWTATFLFGFAGTPFFSIHHGEFVFTWPTCLFVAFQATVHQSYWSRLEVGGWHGRLKSYAVGGVFLLICLTYFVLCRGLSLPFEWAFLIGFPAALPLMRLGLIEFKSFPKIAKVGWRMGTTALAFSAFYWLPGIVIILKY